MNPGSAPLQELARLRGGANLAGADDVPTAGGIRRPAILDAQPGVEREPASARAPFDADAWMPPLVDEAKFPSLSGRSMRELRRLIQEADRLQPHLYGELHNAPGFHPRAAFLSDLDWIALFHGEPHRPASRYVSMDGSSTRAYIGKDGRPTRRRLSNKTKSRLLKFATDNLRNSAIGLFRTLILEDLSPLDYRADKRAQRQNIQDPFEDLEPERVVGYANRYREAWNAFDHREDGDLSADDVAGFSRRCRQAWYAGERISAVADEMMARVEHGGLPGLADPDRQTVESAARALKRAGDALQRPADAPSVPRNFDEVHAQIEALGRLPAPSSDMAPDAPLHWVQAWIGRLANLSGVA
ncbi:MAG: hypothetical protein ABW032_00890 [Burkholderiaceae bacterium]